MLLPFSLLSLYEMRRHNHQVNAQAAGVHAALREFKSGATRQLNEQQVVT
jgi:hypothetical protein